MPLSVGAKLGHYEVLSLLGKGGMGEVYRARDTKLKREVAIKVLPETFARDPDRMARFQREAEVLASLNHPNVAAIYGVEDRGLVMELVEGESPKGPMGFEEAWRIASQIVGALEYAHDKGIVHRDLKPANIKVTPEGVVKLLDFGLAKAFRAESVAAADAENSPTLTLGATEAGVVMGTAAYMSPEQARGKNTDKRADIWSFGVVLYELLTGERPFAGEDAAETLAAVIHKQPDLDRTPVRARKLLRRCLEKDPKKRLRDIGDAWDLLEEEKAPVESAPLPAPSWLRLGIVAMFAAVVFAIIAAGLGWIAWRATRPVEHPLVRLDVDLGSEVSLLAPNTATSSVVLSPDGTRLAYVATASGGQSKLFTRRLDQPKATELPGTEGASDPFFSPDGLWIGFATPGKIGKISVEGGAVVPLGEVSNFAGAWWGDDGNIIVSDAIGKGLVQIPSGGGSSTVIEKLADGEVALAFPQVLPGGKAVLFVDYPSAVDLDNASIDVFTFADRRRKTVARGGVSARYLPTSERSGHLLYSNKGTLFAIPFDLDKLETRGTAVPVLDDVLYAGNGPEAAQFAFSPSGALVYRKGSPAASAMSTVQWLDTAGKKQPLLNKPGAYSNPRLSPDGKRLAVGVREGSAQDISVYDPQRGTTTKLTFGGGIYDFPVWSPDGRFLVFASLGNGIFWARADGGGQPQPLTQSKTIQIPCSFPRDGKRLAYFEIAGGPLQIWTVPIDQDGGQLKAGEAELFSKSQSPGGAPSFSSDGRWLAYSSISSAKNEVYVRAFPDNGSQWQISNNGGDQPHWSPNGRDLRYISGDQIMVAGYTVKGDVFVPEKPGVWIAKLGGTQWDVDPSGNRVAVITPLDAPGTPKADYTFVLLENFFDELRRVALGK
jgi:serine/threonine-protein kinase